jgi:hypothetical protein
VLGEGDLLGLSYNGDPFIGGKNPIVDPRELAQIRFTFGEESKRFDAFEAFFRGGLLSFPDSFPTPPELIIPRGFSEGKVSYLRRPSAPTSVPEPSALVGLGVLALGWFLRKKIASSQSA